EGAVGAGNARVAAERVEHAERGLGVVARAVGLLQLDPQALGHVAERAALLVALDVARPDERVEPLRLALERGDARRVVLRARHLAHHERLVEEGVVRARDAAPERSRDLRRDLLEAWLVLH